MLNSTNQNPTLFFALQQDNRTHNIPTNLDQPKPKPDTLSQPYSRCTCHHSIQQQNHQAITSIHNITIITLTIFQNSKHTVLDIADKCSSNAIRESKILKLQQNSWSQTSFKTKPYSNKQCFNSPRTP